MTTEIVTDKSRISRIILDEMLDFVKYYNFNYQIVTKFKEIPGEGYIEIDNEKINFKTKLWYNKENKKVCFEIDVEGYKAYLYIKFKRKGIFRKKYVPTNCTLIISEDVVSTRYYTEMKEGYVIIRASSLDDMVDRLLGLKRKQNIL